MIAIPMGDLLIPPGVLKTEDPRNVRDLLETIEEVIDG